MQAWVPIRNLSQDSSQATARMTLPWAKAVCNQNVRNCLDGQRWLQRGQVGGICWGRQPVRPRRSYSEMPEKGAVLRQLRRRLLHPVFGATAEQIATVGGVDTCWCPTCIAPATGEYAAFALE
jgi:hypothetical protein